jgi:hypothetical protein
VCPENLVPLFYAFVLYLVPAFSLTFFPWISF